MSSLRSSVEQQHLHIGRLMSTYCTKTTVGYIAFGVVGVAALRIRMTVRQANHVVTNMQSRHAMHEC
jgi:hypothetical protein